ncbi:hypothetical protein BGZ60DRAFT_515376 [Tricladium varicosporioides]|nr:hypothetical protein BGZ60DRAFT_515376 [Hymenoscyphus varicosporioides]
MDDDDFKDWTGMGKQHQLKLGDLLGLVYAEYAIRDTSLTSSGGGIPVDEKGAEGLKFLKLVEKCRVYECAIHCDEVPYGASFFESVKPPTSQCNHDCTVCDMCLKSTFESAIRGSASQNLACPDPECKAILPLDRVKNYNDQLAIKATSQFENFRWTCDHLALIDAKIAARKEQQRLAALRALAIADQEDEWAREAEVKEREDKRKKAQENEVANKATAARISKLCPKVGCGTRIKRISHCAHFTCISCHTHFCWCCKAIWSNGRRIHVTGCKFGTGSTVAKSSLNKSQYARDWDKDLGRMIKIVPVAKGKKFQTRARLRH